MKQTATATKIEMEIKMETEKEARQSGDEEKKSESLSNHPLSMNYLITGVGGQGNVLTSRLLAQAWMHKGYMARTAETIGMAQRGGSVTSHVRIGQVIHSPLITLGQADVLLAFEPGEALRLLPYLKTGGSLISSVLALQPLASSLSGKAYDLNYVLECLKQFEGNILLLDPSSIAKELKSEKITNVAFLGSAISANWLALTREEVWQALRLLLPQKVWKKNEIALQEGAALIYQKEYQKA